MPACIGDPCARYFSTPHEGLLQRATGLRLAADGAHVRLDDSLGTIGIQRLALGQHGAYFWVGLWPAELKSQALYFYTDGRAEGVVASALDLGWTTEASPHLAFWNSAPAQRLYLDPDVELDEYIRRWQEEDRSWIRRRSADELTTAV